MRSGVQSMGRHLKMKQLFDIVVSSTAFLWSPYLTVCMRVFLTKCYSLCYKLFFFTKGVPNQSTYGQV